MSRLVSFSDGVFAIAITLLVLNLHIPVLNAHQTLLQALADQGKEYLSYALSFLLIGQVWINHRALFRLVTRPTHRMLIANLFLLLTIAILPFPTALLARYLGTASQQTAIALFAALLLAACLIYNGIWWMAVTDKVINPHVPQEQIETRTKRSRRRPLLYLLACALAFVWQGQLSLIMCAGLTILFFFPQFSEHAPPQHSTHVAIRK